MCEIVITSFFLNEKRDEIYGTKSIDSSIDSVFLVSNKDMKIKKLKKLSFHFINRIVEF